MIWFFSLELNKIQFYHRRTNEVGQMNLLRLTVELAHDGVD
jgi:hypothetical protein